MKYKKIAILVLLLLYLVAAFSQYTGPVSAKQYTAKEVQEQAAELDKADQLVQLRGYIVDRVNDEMFWFQDASGKVVVEIGKKQMPSFEFNEKTELILVGEVDYDLLEEVEVEVEYIQLAR